MKLSPVFTELSAALPKTGSSLTSILASFPLSVLSLPPAWEPPGITSLTLSIYTIAYVENLSVLNAITPVFSLNWHLSLSKTVTSPLCTLIILYVLSILLSLLRSFSGTAICNVTSLLTCALTASPSPIFLIMLISKICPILPFSTSDERFFSTSSFSSLLTSLLITRLT